MHSVWCSVVVIIPSDIAPLRCDDFFFYGINTGGSNMAAQPTFLYDYTRYGHSLTVIITQL